jgi:hypothetical protein
MAKLQTALTDAMKTSPKTATKTSTKTAAKKTSPKTEVVAVISGDTGKTTVVSPVVEFSDPVDNGLPPVYSDAGMWATLKKTGTPKPEKETKIRINFDISEALYDDIMWGVNLTGHSQRGFISSVLENFIAIAKRSEGLE